MELDSLNPTFAFSDLIVGVSLNFLDPHGTSLDVCEA